MNEAKAQHQREHGAMTLGQDALRRLLIGLILYEQKAVNKAGLIQSDQALARLIIDKSDAEIDAIKISEDVLGFDSLGTLELITALNQFFALSTSGIEDYFLIERHIGAWVDLLVEHSRIVADEAVFGFQTSGSTGASKLVRHSADVLFSEMRAQSEGPFQHIKSPGRIITLVPPYHIYGFLFGCILPELLSCEVIDLHYAAPGAAFRHARAGDLVVATPFHWALLGKSGLHFRENVCGVTSAGPSNPQTWNVIKANSLAQLTEVYGATETAGIGVRTAQNTPFKLLPHLSAVDGQITRNCNQERVDVQDRLAFISPETFHVGDRLDDVVQVGGVNVSPNYVKGQILLLEGVADVAVRPGPERLRAFIVPDPDVDASLLTTRLRAHISNVLPAPARPTSLTFGTELPKTDMGKLTDWL